MYKRLLRIFTVLILSALLLINLHGGQKGSGLLEIYGLSIGQGDSLLIKSPKGRTILVDGGKGSALLAELPKALGHQQQAIDMLIITHLDFDHIGGLLDIIPRYHIGMILMPDQTASSDASRRLFQLIDYNNIPIIHPDPMQDIQIEDQVILDILFPWEGLAEQESLNKNDGSLVAQLRYGNTSLLLTGDIEEPAEQLLLRTGAQLKSTVLKVGHHGSRTSTSNDFLAAVRPQHVILNYGKDNAYGHPHQEVVNKFTDLHIHDAAHQTIHLLCTHQDFCISRDSLSF